MVDSVDFLNWFPLRIDRDKCRRKSATLTRHFLRKVWKEEDGRLFVGSRNLERTVSQSLVYGVLAPGAPKAIPFVNLKGHR